MPEPLTSPTSSLPPGEPVFLPDRLALKIARPLLPGEATGSSLENRERQILNFQTYFAERNTHPRPRNGRHKSRSKIPDMSYLPIKFEKTLSEFPTNKEIEAYNDANPDTTVPVNSALMRTRLKGEDELYLTELQAAKKVDTTTGAVSEALEGIDFMLEVLVKSIISWTFCNYELGGTAIPVTKDAIKQLWKEDFDYLVGEATPIINKMFGVTDALVPSGQEDLAPHSTLTEPEKNLSEPGLNPASEDSETGPAAEAVSPSEASTGPAENEAIG